MSLDDARNNAANALIHPHPFPLYCLPACLQPSDLTVSRASKPQVVAGAVAARAREGVSPRITGIGPEAVCNAMVAACHARLYLEVRQGGGGGVLDWVGSNKCLACPSSTALPPS